MEDKTEASEKRGVMKKIDGFIPSLFKGKVYYGWIVVGACFLMVMMCLGFGSSTKSIYTKTITEQLDIKRSIFTVNDSFRYIATAILSFFFGALVEKLGTRKMVGIGFGFLIASFTLYSFSEVFWQFWIGGALLGIGLAWTTTSIVGHIVEKWFTNGKGTIMGIILAANGLGGFVSEFVINKILFGANGELSQAEAHWRTGYRVTVIIFAVVGLIAFLLIRNRPEDVGLTPRGQDMAKKKKRGLDWEGYEFSVIRRKSYFYIVGACMFLNGFFLQAMSSTSKPHMYDVGLDKNYVMTVYMIHSIILLLAKILSGISYDKLGIRITMAMCTVSSFLAIGSLALMAQTSVVLPWVYGIFSSFALPIETVLIPLIALQLFGKTSYSRIMGYYLALTTLGSAVGIPIINVFYDTQGTYKNIFIIMVIALTLNGIVMQLAMLRADKDRKAFLEARAAAAHVKD